MRTALIGLGRMGLRHLAIIGELGLELVGVSDLLPQARANAAAMGTAADRLFENPEHMLEALSPTCVVVASTAPSHCRLVRLAAQCGAKAILCEKPMAVSLAEADAMIETCLQAGTRLAVNHQMRFMEQYTIAKDIVTGSAFGGLSSVTVLAGNFGLAMNGSHYFEMFRFLAEQAPATVAAWFSQDILANPRGPQFEDRAGAVRLETRNGKRFYMDASTDQGHGMFVGYMGRHGRLEVDELAGRMRLSVRKPEHRNQPTIRYAMPWETSERSIKPADAVAPTRAVMNALLAGANFPEGEIGRAVLEVLVAAYLSHEQNGQVIDLAAHGLPRDRVFPWA